MSSLISLSPAMQDAKEFPKQVTSFFYSHMAFPMEKAAFTHSLDPSSVEYLGFKGHHGLVQAEGCSENYPSNLLPAFSDPVNLCSTTFMFGADQWVCSNSAVLNFEHKLGHGEDSRISIDANMDHQYQMRSSSCISMSDTNCFRMASNYGFTGSEVMDNSQQLGIQQSIGQDKVLQLHKRPFVVNDMQASKKHCGNTRKQAKATKAKENPSKDPQSIAAKNRRERISERLKILQGLVPNGTKVDLVTMLEKAISYVKFLQVQVKVLATDEFWPAHGGKVPEISQVKEAIDAIISSHHRDRNSCSKH